MVRHRGPCATCATVVPQFDLGCSFTVNAISSGDTTGYSRFTLTGHRLELCRSAKPAQEGPGQDGHYSGGLEGRQTCR